MIKNNFILSVKKKKKRKETLNLIYTFSSLPIQFSIRRSIYKALYSTGQHDQFFLPFATITLDTLRGSN